MLAEMVDHVIGIDPDRDRVTAAKRRAWAVEGSGSYGAGACAHLADGGEWVIAFRLPAEPLSELTATKQALRSHPRRIKALAGEVADLQASIRSIVKIVAPQLLDQPGVGPVSAAQIYISWSHPGRCRNEAAFARLIAASPTSR